MRDTDLLTKKIDNYNQSDSEALINDFRNIRDDIMETAKELYNFIHQKVEKLSTGLYMVTSYMPEAEPVRSSLRVLALSSVGHTAHLSVRDISEKYTELEKDIIHITALLKLSQTLEIMSHMNADILIHEYESLKDILGHKKASDLQKKKLNVTVKGDDDSLNHFKNILTNNHNETRLASPAELESFERNYENQTTNISSVLKTGAELSQNDKKIILENTASKKFDSQNRTGLYTKILKLPETKERRSIRQEHLLKVLSHETPMSMSDVSKRVKGCSEKTIQRELQELVDNKKVMRIGEKRWSKYLKI